MKQSIRALGWAITLSMIILFAFLGTAVYSMVQMILEGQGIKLGEISGRISNATLVLCVPLIINNTSQYDITCFNVTLVLRDKNGTVISNQTALIQRVESGSAKTAINNLTLNLADLISKIRDLLFQDTEFKVGLLLSFKYAYMLSFHVDTSNLSMPWGAPLYGFSITGFSAPYNITMTECYIDIYLSFENHAFFDINGTLRIEMFNDRNEPIGIGIKTVSVSSNQSFADAVTVHIDKLTGYTGSGYVKIYFESLSLGIIDIGRVCYD
ncbi:TPA: hypothetical protein EYP70_02530 [Candidatus Bathyarchaeota archaeon]|nr:hypothetical protein [Candidatus Bathyarchaeota archaeon]